jgi:hypothetical protein
MWQNDRKMIDVRPGRKASQLRSWLYRIFLLAALAGIARCGANAPSPGPPAVQVPTAELGGMWTGTTRVTPCQISGERCDAVNNVTFNLSQYGSQITGNYACEAGNADCRHGGADDSGKIYAGSASGSRINLAVRLPADTSDCYYSGSAGASNQASGVYVCYRGGMLIEEGVWNLVRQSAE